MFTVRPLREFVLIDCRELTTAAIAYCREQFSGYIFPPGARYGDRARSQLCQRRAPPTIQVSVRSGGWTRAFVEECGIYKTVAELTHEAAGVLTEVSLQNVARTLWGSDMEGMTTQHHSDIRLTLGPWTNSGSTQLI